MACVPTFPALQSLKARVYSRGYVYTGTNNAGFIILDPVRSSTNDGDSIYFTSTTAAPTQFTVVAAAGVAAANTNASYAQADFNLNESGFGVRVVSSGIRIRYAGTELNRGGNIIALQDPTHSTLDGRTPAEMLAEMQARSFPVNRQWTTVLYKPVSSGDLNFAQANPGASQAYYVGLWIAGATSSAPFEYEVYSILEYQGVNVRGQSPSHTDPTGFAAVHSVSVNTNVLNATQLPNNVRERNSIAATMDYLSHGLSSATSTVGQIANSAMGLGKSLNKAYEMVAPAIELL